MKDNPNETIDAMTNPKPLTLGKIALLEKISSPLLVGNYSRLADNLKAVWVYRTPTSEAAKNIDKVDELATAMGDALTLEEYQDSLLELLGGITEFFAMLPRPEAEKKTLSATATDGLPK